MKPTRKEVSESVVMMSRVIPFFPGDEIAKEIVIASLCDFVGERLGLEWLTNTALRVMSKWTGIAGLRGLYCTRYAPCDGLPATASDIPGFTPSEAMDAAEMAYLEREAKETDRKLLEWKREAARQIGPGDVKALTVSDVMPQAVHGMLRPRVQDIREARSFQRILEPVETGLPEIDLQQSSSFPKIERKPVPPANPLSDKDRALLESEPWYQEWAQIAKGQGERKAGRG
jgi:hypothetical protein